MNKNNSTHTPTLPVGIRSTGHYLPAKCLTNEELVRQGSPVSPEWIVKKTGIQTRHVADASEAMSDLVNSAATRALKSANLNPSEIDALIVAGDNHDSGGVQLTSALVANALGIYGAACFDLRIGCPASVVALHQGTALVSSGLANRVLIGVGEVNTRGIDFTDRTAVWFGDGAGAVILERCDDAEGILATQIVGEGNNSDILIIPAGGSREPLTHEGLDMGRNQLYMDGRAVFPYAIEKITETVKALISHMGMSIEELDWIIPHHANMRIIEAAMQELGYPIEQVYVNLDRYGNTAGPSILIALSEALENHAIKPGDIVLTVGFGGGLAWGGQIIRINHGLFAKNVERRKNNVN